MSEHIYSQSDSRKAANKRVFSVSSAPKILRAAGMAEDECVPVFIRVNPLPEDGACPPAQWTPYKCKGQSVEICGCTGDVFICAPGVYSVGDPNQTDLSLSEDAVIEAVSTADMDSETLAICLGKSDGPIEIDTSNGPVETSDSAVLQKVCDLLEAIENMTNLNVDKEYYCSTETKTQWVKVCSYVQNPNGSITEEIIREEDTGMPCAVSYSFEQHYCVM